VSKPGDARLFVENLPDAMSEAELARLFGPYGRIVRARIVHDARTGWATARGLVDMSSPNEADGAAAAMNGRQVGGSILSVSTPAIAGSDDMSLPPRRRWRLVWHRLMCWSKGR